MTKSGTGDVVGVHEAKTHLSRLLGRVAAGEEIEISNRGRVVARLVPPARSPERRLGMDAGSIWMSPDFDAPLDDDFLDAFDG